VWKNIPYSPFSACLAHGDTLLGYTDGIIEAMGTGGAQYGEERFLETLAHAAKDAEEITARLLASIETFTAGTEAFDDITLIAVQRS
jgi:sigma-B regulation protein RsbU (phosphoserine phosphatase)